MKKGNLLLTVLMFIVLCFTTVGFAKEDSMAPSMYREGVRAIDAAKAEIPETCVLTSYDVDGEKSVVAFYDQATTDRYKVKVLTGTSKVLEIERKGATFVKGSTMVNLSVEDIKKIVLAHFPDAKNIEVELDSDGNNKYYEAKFMSNRFAGELEMNPVTGAIFELDLKFY